MRKLTIAIDGPSGAGKSSLGKALARALGYQYVDSGAVYRAVGLLALGRSIPLTDTAGIAELARQSSIRQVGDPDSLRILVDGIDVTTRIRMPDVSHASSVVATVPEVREAIVNKLREMNAAGGIVMDGRDIGTKVFPEADVKLFIDASDRVRAERRWQEEHLRGRQVTLEQTLAEIEDRDRRDRERAATPLVRAPDAILIDTTDTSPEEVLRAALEIVSARR
jgi:CMP/dCMP kinase